MTLRLYSRVSQPGFRGTIGFREMLLGVPQEAYLDKEKKSSRKLKKKKN
jgi:hypothetical protein